MAGTKVGGQKAAATNKQRYGLLFYQQIGKKGGEISRGGGFAYNRELARTAGSKGGKASHRGPSKSKAVFDDTLEQQVAEEALDQTASTPEVATAKPGLLKRLISKK